MIPSKLPKLFSPKALRLKNFKYQDVNGKPKCVQKISNEKDIPNAPDYSDFYLAWTLPLSISNISEKMHLTQGNIPRVFNKSADL